MRRREDKLCRILTSFKRLYCLVLTQDPPPKHHARDDFTGLSALPRPLNLRQGVGKLRDNSKFLCADLTSLSSDRPCR